MPTYSDRGFTKRIDVMLYKDESGKVYKGINPRGCYIDMEGETKTYKKVHSTGYHMREVEYQIEYRHKQTKTVFKMISPEPISF